jgi:hypothetical protein
MCTTRKAAIDAQITVCVDVCRVTDTAELAHRSSPRGRERNIKSSSERFSRKCTYGDRFFLDSLRSPSRTSFPSALRAILSTKVCCSGRPDMRTKSSTQHTAQFRYVSNKSVCSGQLRRNTLYAKFALGRIVSIIGAITRFDCSSTSVTDSITMSAPMP